MTSLWLTVYNSGFKAFQQCSHCIQIDNEECDSDENEFTQFNFGYDPSIQAGFQLSVCCAIRWPFYGVLKITFLSDSNAREINQAFVSITNANVKKNLHINFPPCLLSLTNHMLHIAMVDLMWPHVGPTMVLHLAPVQVQGQNLAVSQIQKKSFVVEIIQIDSRSILKMVIGPVAKLMMRLELLTIQIFTNVVQAPWVPLDHAQSRPKTKPKFLREPVNILSFHSFGQLSNQIKWIYKIEFSR